MFDHRVVLNSIDDLSQDLVQFLRNFAPDSTRNIFLKKPINRITNIQAERKEEEEAVEIIYVYTFKPINKQSHNLNANLSIGTPSRINLINRLDIQIRRTD